MAITNTKKLVNTGGLNVISEYEPESEERKRKKNSACDRCRKKHTKCDGTGPPCSKCKRTNSLCEYQKGEQKIVMSMKYLNDLHGEIHKLKIENASLRNSLKKAERDAAKHQENSTLTTLEQQQDGTALKADNMNSNTHRKSAAGADDHKTASTGNNTNNTTENKNEVVIPPFLDKDGQLIHSRTGESIYIGSSSVTLFGLEINKLVSGVLDSSTPSGKNSETILEREGNAYRIMLGKTHSRPGIDVNFTLPSYSYAMLLVDTFISYNDGCFYFFNEGLVKEGLRRIYDEDQSKPFKPDYGKAEDGKPYEDESTLETIWFCKVLLIFAVGEMYLGTANNLDGYKLSGRPHKKRRRKDGSKPGEADENERQGKHSRSQKHKYNSSKEAARLPGSGFFNQASGLFTGLFASGAIDNCAREGGIEVLLLYAFYLQVADCTVASYFYFGLALRASLSLGLHVDIGKHVLNRYELEHRRRIWWTVYMYERMLASKAGLPLSITDDDISTALPDDFDMSSPPAGCENYIFPEAEFIRNCVKITQINTKILQKLYTRHPLSNILPVVHDLVFSLLKWKIDLPDFINCDFSVPELKISRLVVNLMTEYFQGVNLAVRPLLFHFVMINLKAKKKNTADHVSSDEPFIDLSRYSSVILNLLNASFQASINTIRSLWALMLDNMVALFGYMDREYLFTSAVTLILFNSTFGVHSATLVHLDHALTIFTKMRNLGNHPATLRREQILKLLTILDFRGAMHGLINKHVDHRSPPDSSINSESSGGFRFTQHSEWNSNNSEMVENIATYGPADHRKRMLSSGISTGSPSHQSTTTESLRPSFKSSPGTEEFESSSADQSIQHSESRGANHIMPHTEFNNTSSNDFDARNPIFSPRILSSFGGLDDFSDLDAMVNGTAEDAELWKDITSQAAWLTNNQEFDKLAKDSNK